MSGSGIIDNDTLRRYDQPGPRYTSYPTAPQFTAEFGERQLRKHIDDGNSRPVPAPISLYLHVPFCFSPCFYCGCNRVITRDLRKGERYLDYLYQEISVLSPLFGQGREVVQLHLGGGTPNFLRPKQLDQLVAYLGTHFRFSDEGSRDFSIELDPRFIGRDDIARLRAAGFNRASFGVQDFAPDVQRAVNRVQGVEETLAIIAACRDAGFRSVNVDLIYGLPRQTPRGFASTIDTLIDERPDRLAIYGYAHLPNFFKAQNQINPEELPDAGQRLDLLRLAIEKLTSAGYEYVGMDHFALPEDELCRARATASLHRNFMGYTTHANCDLVGIGVSAISHIGNSFSQNPRDIAGWERSLDAGGLPVWRGLTLDDDDLLRADIIQQLMCGGKIDIVSTELRHGIQFKRYFASIWPRLERLASRDLISIDSARLVATRRGRYLLRVIASCFDRYLENEGDADRQGQFSKAI